MINKQGYSLVEMAVAVLLTSLLALTVVKVFSGTISYTHDSSVRQTLQSDADSSMSTIVHALQQAKGSTVVICSCQATACDAGSLCDDTNSGVSPPIKVPPNSRLEFTDIHGNATAIYWTNHQIFLQKGAGSAQLLASNVTGLLFGGDMQDPTHLTVSMRLDAATSPQHNQMLMVANQIVRLSQ